ncbi:SubName: Full=Uncharacterized protein {ECO:0000313/EMBL:CCA71357.1} [Serendipita indica DSM 11827]|nr:SubName: Full=Uncharacterized protein {ECO:0000313/EMBL:CCA71357.1} [Serendipita indica DSM 11827]
MVVRIVETLLERTVSVHYYLPLFVGIVSVLTLRAWFSGKRTDRERDLHGRTILVTGATSSLGITLVTELARRGAQVIGVVEDTADPTVLSLFDLIRHTTNNELVYAEQCDLSSPNAIKDFCAQLIKSSGGGLESEPPRLDAIIYAHEYPHIGAIQANSTERAKEDEQRLHRRLASFFFTTLLLPVLLTAPEERDIRFITVVPPLYAAAIPSFTPRPPPPSEKSDAPVGVGVASPSLWVKEGARALDAILFTRHFQRILDALPTPSVKTQVARSTAGPTSSSKNTVELEPEAVAAKRPSNIIALAVSPGFSRTDTIAPYLLRRDKNSTVFSFVGLIGSVTHPIRYTLALPLLYIFAKSSDAAIQTVLHALFLPTPLKATRAAAAHQPTTTTTSTTRDGSSEEYVRGGALYAECARVLLPGNAEQRLGSELVGQRVWENLEAELARWRTAEQASRSIEKN